MLRDADWVGTAILATLTAATAALGAVMAWNGKASVLEAVSFVTGAVCVWLTVRENVWNFPIGLLNVMTFSIVFFRAQLYADAGLQVIYFVLGLVGWYLWLYGGERHTRLKVALATWTERAAVLAFAVVSTLMLWQLLRHVGGSASFWDALTTSLSLGAQWLLNRKRLENWAVWLVVDVIYVPLYIYKELYLTAILYGVFLVMASMGLWRWYRVWRQQRNEAAPATAVPAEVCA